MPVDVPSGVIVEEQVLHGDEIPVVLHRRNVVPADVRTYVAEHDLTRRDDAWATRRTVVLFGGWAVAIAAGVAADHVAAWIAVALFTTVWFTAIFPYVHQATHGNLFTRRTTNHLWGGIAGAVVLMPTCTYRAYHATHHAWTRTEGDPEHLPETYRNKWHYAVIFLATGIGLSAILWVGTIGVLAGRPPSWARFASHRRHVRRWIALPLAVLALVAGAAAVHPTAVFWGWVVPTLVTNLFTVAFVSLPDHVGSRLELTILENSRTTISNRFGRWVCLYDNYHAAHHLVPNVPPVRLAELDSRIRDRTTLVAPTFASVHRETFAGLRWFAMRSH